MAGMGDLREVIARAEQHPARWLVVALGVIILLRLKLVLFAAALPLMAYWHYSSRAEEAGDAEPEGCDGADADADLDSPWLPEGDEAEAEDDSIFPADADLDAPFKQDGDPYDRSFWSADAAGAPGKNAPWRNTSRTAPKSSVVTGGGDGDDDPLGLPPLAPEDDVPKPKPSQAPVRADGAGDDLLDWGLGLPGSTSASGKGADRGSGSWNSDSFAGGGEADLLGSLDLGLGLGPGDDDLLGFAPGGRGSGKGKGKGKGGDKGPRDPMAPREANPKQVFVANVADMPEDDIRTFFEDVGEIDRLKVLLNPDGSSKGVCFVTFRTEEQAQKALGLHGSLLEGRSLVVRLAHAGNKGGDKGGGKGGKGGGDRFGTHHEGVPDLGGSERFGPAFGDGERERGDRGPGGFGDRGPGGFGDRGPGGFGDRGPGGFGKGRGGKGGKRTDRNEMDELLEEALADGDGPVKPGDFDFAARRFLTELRSRDRCDGTDRFQSALDMVLKYTSSKDRSSVRKWPAYIFTLLQKFDSNLWEELRERDAERRREKGGGGFGGARERRPLD